MYIYNMKYIIFQYFVNILFIEMKFVDGKCMSIEDIDRSTTHYAPRSFKEVLRLVKYPKPF